MLSSNLGGYVSLISTFGTLSGNKSPMYIHPVSAIVELVISLLFNEIILNIPLQHRLI